MEELNLDQIKQKELNILNEIHLFCQKNNIKYYLMYGTLIGAIRHKGFIPWDDDIDIAMPRKDYEVFVKTFNKSRNDCFRAIYPENSPGYYCAFAKVIDSSTLLVENIDSAFPIGVYVDVFPLDNIPNSSLKKGIFFAIAKVFINILNLKLIKINKKRKGYKNTILSVGKFLLKPLSISTIVAAISKHSQKYNNDETCKCMGNMCLLVYKDREFWKKSNFEKHLMMDFEGRSFVVPEKYDEVLKKTYGDYMKLPPEDKRVSHHDNTVYQKRATNSR